MALSLILRNATKSQGCVLRFNSSLFRTVGPASCFTNFASNGSRKAPVGFAINASSKAIVRNMSGGSDHRMKWTIERLLSISLVGLIPAAIAFPNVIFDNLTAIIVTLHIHWGVEAMVEDYVRPIIFGNVISKFSLMSVYVVSAIILGGLLYFNINDIGLGKGIRKFWAIKSS